MKTKHILPALLGMAAFSVSSISSAEQGAPNQAVEPSPDSPPAEAATPTPLIKSDHASRLDAMTVKFLSELLKSESPEDNPSLSPLALATALEALKLGADGQTANELAALLAYGKDSPTLPSDDKNSTWSWIASNAGGADWKLNHGLWYHVKNPLLPSYLKIVMKQPALTLEAVDFGKPGAGKLLSDWAERHSDGKLKEPVSPSMINDLTRLVWISLLSYHGKWQHRFDPGKNNTSAFHAPGGDVQVTMMNGHMDLTILQQEGYGTVALLPMKGGKTVMEVRLPEQALTRAELAVWLLKTSPDIKAGELASVPVAFPKAEMKSRISWLPTIEKLGAKDLLVEADFSKASEEGGLRLTELATETSIRFDESGAEVVSSAAAVVGARSVNQPTKELRLNRPFVWIIRETRNGIPLACGLLERPPAAKDPAPPAAPQPEGQSPDSPAQ